MEDGTKSKARQKDNEEDSNDKDKKKNKVYSLRIKKMHCQIARHKPEIHAILSSNGGCLSNL
jgi:hypothetical protein